MEYVIYEARETQIEMRKEIQFLSNYIQLINQQEGSNVQLELEYGEGYEKLKIAPLLLTGLIDSIVVASQPGNNNQCTDPAAVFRAVYWIFQFLGWLPSRCPSFAGWALPGTIFG